MAADEVQSGMGRTGRMFAYQHSEVEPDLVIMGKALGGGLPLSALAAPASLSALWPEGAHGTTFGGNALSCAAGLATLRVIQEEHLIEAADQLGSAAIQRLAPLLDLPQVLEVRGRGLMVALEFQGEGSGELAGEVVVESLRAGMVLHTAGLRHEVIRLMPPLNIGAELWGTALDQLAEVVGRVCSAPAAARR